LSPWWLRPTAEGATNESDADEKREAESRAATPAAEPAAAPPATEPAHQEPPPASFPRTQAFEPRSVAPPAEAPSAWEPRESPRETAASEPASLQAEAESPALHTAEPHRHAERFHDASATTEPAAVEAEAASHAAEVSPALDGETAEREEGQGEAGGEKKRSRSRRSRGGRRKSGRSAGAAPSPGTPGADDEDDDFEGEDEALETPEPQPAPAPVAQIHHRGREAREARETAKPAENNFYLPPDYEISPREVFVPVERPRSHNDERKIALFCDLENIALGVRDSEVGKFDIHRVLERLLEKGKIIVKKAYADWERYSDYKRPFHEAAIELIDIPQKYYSGKNSADIKMVVDAMDLSYSKEHLDTFVLLSGDSDFSPLVSKLKENNKYVIGIGVKNSSSNLLVDNCDEFIYYEDVWRDSAKAPQLAGLTKKAAEAFSLMVESIQALVRENKDVLWGSMIKQTMQRKKPSFNEGYFGYSTFSELLEDAERKNIIKLKKDQRSGTYIVTGFAKR
jgi:uncharacterized protein (TIGR00288 family)